MDEFRPKPRPASSPTRRVWNERLERLESKLLHAAELIADKYAEQYSAEPEGPAPAAVHRRATANALRIWRKCPQATCRQSRACRGEPARCLDACMPALPPGAVAAHIAGSRRRPRR